MVNVFANERKHSRRQPVRPIRSIQNNIVELRKFRSPLFEVGPRAVVIRNDPAVTPQVGCLKELGNVRIRRGRAVIDGDEEHPGTARSHFAGAQTVKEHNPWVGLPSVEPKEIG